MGKTSATAITCIAPVLSVLWVYCFKTLVWFWGESWGTLLFKQERFFSATYATLFIRDQLVMKMMMTFCLSVTCNCLDDVHDVLVFCSLSIYTQLGPAMRKGSIKGSVHVGC